MNHLTILQLAILLLATLTSSHADEAGSSIPNIPYNPHIRATDYTENFRPQFHFSPRSGWMNDINALVYQDGVYHMLYQWGRDIRHGGYATSTDLLHWEDKGVALVPQDSNLPKDAIRNMAGKQIYSGSGVLVSGETAMKITGADKPALVTHYTGTGVGTCIAWSNDQGATWNNYQGNPVAHPTPNADPRDPRVFWYEPTQSWILALYEKGTTFYGSKDLLKWEHLSQIPFGFECPDIFELALDGDPANKKWVLHDADGKYLVGQFNGKEFLPEQNEPLRMDVGPDFYAAQTFFRPSLPDGKVIQIAWNDHWNGGVGEKDWERNATFPVEIGLVTDQGKMRVTRTPIEAIRRLYHGTWNVEAQILGEKNVLADIQSKTFDLTATFDLTKATANRIVFRVANRTLSYDIGKKALVGVTKNRQGVETEAFFDLKPDSANLLVIRMLVDWCSIEVFANRGVFSYSENTALPPRVHSVSLSAQGGEVKLLSFELNELKSIWNKDTGTLQSPLFPDSDPAADASKGQDTPDRQPKK